MLPRRAALLVEQALDRAPAVALLGPRQVGKTTLARAIADGRDQSVYLDLERAADRARLSDAEAFLEPLAGRLVVIDEVHRAPSLFEELRGAIDRRRAGFRHGQFLILGSASIDLLKQSSETLAGRIAAYVELDPVSIREALEYAPDSLNALWLRGGFPDSLLATSDKASLAWRTNFVRSYLERDIQQFAGGVSAHTIERLWTMLAHTQGGLFNASRFAQSLDVSARTVGRYLDLLEGLLLVRTLRPWRGNVGKRVVAAPKIYLCDSGIVHALLNISTREELLGHPVVGGSWEGMVIGEIIAAAPDRSTAWFYRTSAGAEIDLVLELSPGRLAAFEIKRSAPASLPAGFRNACEDISAAHRFIVYPGPGSYPTSGGVTVLAASDIAERVGGLKSVRAAPPYHATDMPACSAPSGATPSGAPARREFVPVVRPLAPRSGVAPRCRRQVRRLSQPAREQRARRPSRFNERDDVRIPVAHRLAEFEERQIGLAAVLPPGPQRAWLQPKKVGRVDCRQHLVGIRRRLHRSSSPAFPRSQT